MILKEKDSAVSQDIKAAAGNNHEKDVAYYLRREFADAKDVLVLNDIRIEHAGEKAQIDHLVLHPKGFLIIESKSICGELKVNAQGEWSRSYKEQWMGMPSPIRQAEIQADLLRDWLNTHRESFFDKIPLLVRTLGVVGYEWKVLCAVSSNAILHREGMPKKVSEQVIKAEFIAIKVKEVSAAKGLLHSFVTTQPLYTQKALEQLSSFILEKQPASHTQTDHALATPTAQSSVVPTAYEAVPPIPQIEPPTLSLSPTPLSCRKCGKNDALTGMWGKYGYYVKCGHCQGNTPMKKSCPRCHSEKTRVTKQLDKYFLACEDCAHSSLIFQNKAIESA